MRHLFIYIILAIPLIAKSQPGKAALPADTARTNEVDAPRGTLFERREIPVGGCKDLLVSVVTVQDWGAATKRKYIQLERVEKATNMFTTITIKSKAAYIDEAEAVDVSKALHIMMDVMGSEKRDVETEIAYITLNRIRFEVYYDLPKKTWGSFVDFGRITDNSTLLYEKIEFPSLVALIDQAIAKMRQ